MEEDPEVDGLILEADQVHVHVLVEVRVLRVQVAQVQVHHPRHQHHHQVLRVHPVEDQKDHDLDHYLIVYLQDHQVQNYYHYHHRGM